MEGWEEEDAGASGIGEMEEWKSGRAEERILCFFSFFFLSCFLSISFFVVDLFVLFLIFGFCAREKRLRPLNGRVGRK